MWGIGWKRSFNDRLHIGWCAIAHHSPTVSLLRYFFLEQGFGGRAEQFVEEFFKSVPGALSPILYSSAASLRCIIQADAGEPVIEQCGNPIAPTFSISSLFVPTWGVGYILNPIAKHKREYTWGDVIKLRFVGWRAPSFPSMDSYLSFLSSSSP